MAQDFVELIDDVGLFPSKLSPDSAFTIFDLVAMDIGGNIDCFPKPADKIGL